MTKCEAIEILRNEKSCISSENSEKLGCKNSHFCPDKNDILSALEMAINALSENEWILLTPETMPEEFEDVLTASPEGDCEVNHIIDMKNVEGECEWLHGEVEAWMPLPYYEPINPSIKYY